ncbi:hypothetical protein ACI3KY_18610 [Microbacterium sp. ZW T2_14]|uniref:hypothetical protein n=1 Tax=Microbacterium sp. ZW T2_14 TaxID=3378079 RepID=UPI003854E398
MAAAVAAVVLDTHTHGRVGRHVTLDAGNNILVAADDRTGFTVVSGGLGVGFVGVGAGVAVVSAVKDTAATIGAGSLVDARASRGWALGGIPLGTISGDSFPAAGQSGLALLASSAQHVFGMAISGGAGFVGVSGAVNVTLIRGTTVAAIESTSADRTFVNSDRAGAGAPQSVSVTATDLTDTFTIGGGVAGGFVGVAGGIDIGVVDVAANALVGDYASIQASSHLRVQALSVRHIQTYAVSAGGGAVGVTASVSVWTAGGQPTGSYDDGSGPKDALSSSDGTPQSQADHHASGTGSTGYLSILGGANDSSGTNTAQRKQAGIDAAAAGVAGAAPGTSLASSAFSSPPPLRGTTSRIGVGAFILTGGSVAVTADARDSYFGLAGSATGGIVAVGASVLVVTLRSTVDAGIATGTTVRAGGDVATRATYGEATEAIAFTGQIGAVSVGGQILVLDTDARQTAHIDDGVVIPVAAGIVSADAAADRDVRPLSLGLAIALAAAGASVATADVRGDTVGRVGAVAIGTAAAPAGGLRITAVSDISVPVTAFSVSVGLAGSGTGAGAIADITGRTAAEFAGVAHLSGAATIAADARNVIDADTVNVQVGAVAIGVTLAHATITRETTATAVDGSWLSAGGAIAMRATSRNRADAFTPGGSLSAISASFMNPEALITGRTEAIFRADVAGSGSLTVDAEGQNQALAEAFVIGIGLLGSGQGVDASAEVTTAALVRAVIELGTVFSSGLVAARARILTDGGSGNVASAIITAGSGGLVSGGGYVATAFLRGATTAEVSGIIGGSGSVEVRSTATNRAAAETFTAGFGGILQVSVAYAESEIAASAATRASIFSPVWSHGATTVVAQANNTADVDSDAATIGLINANVRIISATIAAATRAELRAGLVGNGLTVEARGTNLATASAAYIEAGLFNGGFGSALAVVTDAAGITAEVAAGTADVRGGAGAVAVTAWSENTAATDMKKVTVAGLDINGLLPRATVAAATRAAFAAGPATSTSFGVTASSRNAVDATGELTSISIIGVDGTVAAATIAESAATTASVAAGVMLAASGAVSLLAESRDGTHALADIDSAGGGAVKAGVVVAQATVWAPVTAAFDGTIIASTGVSVRAVGHAKADATIEAVGIALVGITGSVVDAEVVGSAAVLSRYGTGMLVTTGGVLVETVLTATATAKSDLVSGGVLVVGVSVPTARIAAAAVADAAPRQVGGTSLAVRATANRAVSATSGSLALGLIAVSISSAEALITAAAVTRARVHDGATVHAPAAALTVDATATNAATAAGGGVNGGAITVGVAEPKALVDSSTLAQFAATVAAAASLGVHATTSDTATAKLASTAIGAITIDSGRAWARVRPVAEAIVGVGTPIVVSGDIDVRAASQPVSRSFAENFSAAALAVSSNSALAETFPTVKLSVANGTTLWAGGAVTLTAHQNSATPPPLPVYAFDAVTGVDLGTNTITLSGAHTLDDSATVRYDRSGGTAVGGLTDGAKYGVIVVSPTQIQLGAAFEPAQVDPADDVITFTRQHGFVDGQRVFYTASGFGVAGLVNGHAYRVRVLDDFRVQLIDADTPSAPVEFDGGDVDEANGLINAVNSYTDGQMVQYLAAAARASFYSTRVDIVVDAQGSPVQVGSPPTFQIEDNNVIAVREHGLQTGDAVVYRATGGPLGGLSQDTTYWVIRIDGNRIQLADSQCHALGTCDDGGGGVIPITALGLVPDISEAGRTVIHQLFAPGQQPIAGLQNGGVYEVCDATPTSFGLKLVELLGVCFHLPLGANGSVGTSRFVPAVVDLGPALGGGKLVVDLTAAGTGTQHLQVATMAPSLPSGTYSEAKVAGEGGGFIQVGETRPRVVVDATLDLTIGDGARIVAGGEIGVHALNTAAGVADGTSGGIGAISITHARAVVSATATTTVSVRPGTDLSSTGGSVTIDPLTLASGNAYAYSSAGGFGHGTEAQTRADLGTTSHVTLDGRITAWNDIAASSSTATQSELRAGASGGSFAGSSTSGDCGGDPCHIVANNDTTLTVGGAAHLEADNVTLAAQMITTSLLDHNRSNGDGAFEDSDARSEVTLTSNAHVHLVDGAKIIGYQTVTVRAQHLDLRLVADARATCGCFGGDSDADAIVRYNATSSVTGEAGVRVRTATLRVEALHLQVVVDPRASTGGGFIDFGGDDNSADDNRHRWIDWNADVVLHAPNPTLVVDSTGRIVKKYAVTVRDDLGTVYILGQTIPEGREIVVDPIENNGGGSATYFINNPAGSQVGTLTGDRGTLQVQNTFDFVRLHNHSSRLLRVNGISVVNLDDVGATVDVQAEVSTDFRFHIGRPIFTPTFVDIANWTGPGTPDIVLAGFIDNPIGTTRVINEHGDIWAQGAGSIRTNIAQLHANQGTIGASFTLFGIPVRLPIPVVLVQSDYVVDDVDPTRPVELVADARDDVVLDLTYVARMPLGSPYAGTAFQPVLGPIHAGDDIDLLVHDSLSGSDVPVMSSYWVQVNVTHPPSNTTVPPTGQYHTYFHPDPGPWGGFDDPVLVAWGTVNELHDSAYTFSDLSAGDDIVVRHPSLATDISFVVFSNVDATLFSMRFPAQQYSTQNGDGEITLYTNGFVEDYETIADLRVGTITSTADDVYLQTMQDTASILDEGTIDDGTPRVAGRSIVMIAGLVSGRIGGPDIDPTDSDPTDTAPDFLEIRSSLSARGSLTALAAGDILLDQVAGTLFVALARSLTADVALRTRAGGIQADAPTGAVRVAGRDIDLIAVGGRIGTDSADRSADLVVDTGTGSRLYALSLPGDAVIFVPPTGVFVTEASGSLLVLRAEATTGDVRLTVPFVAGGDDESLFLLTEGRTIDELVTVTEGRIVAGDDVTLLVGQDVIAPLDTLIEGSTVTIRASFGKTSALDGGSLLYFGGTVTGAPTRVFGGLGDDVFSFDATVVNGPIFVHGDAGDDLFAFDHTVVNGPMQVFGAAGDDDFFFLETLLGGHTEAFGDDPTDPLALQGDDSFQVWWLHTMTGTHIAALGDDFAGTEVRDSLVLWGHGGDNDFRIQTWGAGDAAGHDYRIVVRGGGARTGLNTLTIDGTDAADLFLFRALAGIAEHADARHAAFVAQLNLGAGTAETIAYDEGVNARLTVNGYDGDDVYVFDDNSAITTVYGGDGDDTFVVGQFFATPRIEPNVQPGSAFATVETEFGNASAGVSFPAVLYGGEGADSFLINGHRAELRIEGTTGADLFRLLAVRLLAGGYRANGFLSLDGGAGTPTVQVLATVATPELAVALRAILGAGLLVKLYHVPLPALVIAPVVLPAPVVLTAEDAAPPAPLVIPVPPVVPGAGEVVIVESDGTTTLQSGVKETDSYTIALSTPPTARVYITISAAYGGGIPYAQVSIDGGVTFHDQVVLIFEIGETGPKTVIVRLLPTTDPHPFPSLLTAAPSNEPGPGMVVETVSHTVVSDDALYDGAAARNVYINAPADPPEEPEEPGEPEQPGQPGQPGDAGQPAASAGGSDGDDLAATGVEGLQGWMLSGLGLLLLGLLLLVARRRRQA